MPKFIVTVGAKVLMVTHVEVEADSFAEAKTKGFAEVSDDIAGHDWEFADDGGPLIEDTDLSRAVTVTDDKEEQTTVEFCDECSGTRYPKEEHEEHCSLHETTNEKKPVCPNCGQFQSPRGIHLDCFNECAHRGFAPKVKVSNG